MRFILAMLVIGAFLVVVGGNQLWVYFQNPQPIEMSIDDYLRTRPQGRWVRLTRCTVDYPAGVYIESTRHGRATSVVDVSVPVYARYDPRQPVAVVFSVANERRTHLLRNGGAYGVRTETIEGLVRGGPFYSGLSQKLRDAAKWKLAPSYVIIDEGRTPQFATPAAMFAGGVSVLLWLVVTLPKRLDAASHEPGGYYGHDCGPGTSHAAPLHT